MRFDQPLSPTESQFASLRSTHLAAVRDSFEPLPARYLDSSNKPIADGNVANGDDGFIIFAGYAPHEDHSSDKTQEERISDIMQHSPELHDDALVANRTRDVVMDLLGIDREKSSFETVSRMSSEQRGQMGGEMETIAQQWFALSKDDRAVIESELQAFALNPESKTPSLSKFANQDWSTGLRDSLISRRDTYLLMLSYENK